MVETQQTENKVLTVGTIVRIVKGCKARGIDKGCSAKISDVTLMGADYSHFVKIVFTMLNGFKGGKTLVFYARHENRLSDSIVRMNDGNPSHVIEVARA